MFISYRDNREKHSQLSKLAGGGTISCILLKLPHGHSYVVGVSWRMSVLVLVVIIVKVSAQPWQLNSTVQCVVCSRKKK